VGSLPAVAKPKPGFSPTALASLSATAGWIESAKDGCLGVNSSKHAGRGSCKMRVVRTAAVTGGGGHMQRGRMGLCISVLAASAIMCYRDTHQRMADAAAGGGYYYLGLHWTWLGGLGRVLGGGGRCCV
jgi:hypothetical protein